VTDAVAAEGLVKDYGEVRALGPLDLSIDAGEVVSLVGPNGAGKSTLLRLAAGRLERSAGRIEVCSQRPGSLEARRLASFVPDTPVLYEDLSIGEMVEFVARLHGQEAWEPRAQQLIEQFDLVDRRDQLSVHLSRGLRQRVALILGLVRPFSVLLLDEPFGTLDAESVKTTRELIRQQADQGATVIVSSHQPNLLRATRTIRLVDGHLAGP
jgi:ABC-type multidrug transport system ATPase subunit